MIDMKIRAIKLVLLIGTTLIYGNVFSQTSTTLLVTPKLLWQKEFKTPIDSIAISSDGTKIAITIEPEVKKIRDDNYYTLNEESEFRNPDGSYYKGIKYHWYGSKLHYLDTNGNILWEYEHKEMSMLSNVVMSDDGKYIACSVIACKTEDREITHVLPATPPVPLQETKKMQVWKYSEILFFNSTGTLLWSFKVAGKPKISSDGNYLFIIPATEEGYPLGDFYFLNKNGKKLWKMPSFEGPVWEAQMTKDANRIIIGDTLYDRDGHILWKLEKGLFTNISNDGSMARISIPDPEAMIGGNFIYPYVLKAVEYVDLDQKKSLWKIEEGIPVPDYIREKYLWYRTPEVVKEDRNKFPRWGGSEVRGNYVIIAQWTENKDKRQEYPIKWETKIYFCEIDGTLKWTLTLPGGRPENTIKISSEGKYIVIGLYNSLFFYDNSEFIK